MKETEFFCGWGHIHRSQVAATKCKNRIEGALNQHTIDLQKKGKKGKKNG